MSIVEKSVEFLSKTIESWDFSSIPLIIGVCGPQGSGKSYLSSNLAAILRKKYTRINTIYISIDDFYLTHKEQHEILPKLYPDCDLITTGRGLPGTHSINMILQVLEKVKARQSNYRIPLYDKSRYNGEGDRLPIDEWLHVESGKPIDILILEGWFIGYESIPSNDSQLNVKWKNVLSLEKNNDIKAYFETIDFKQIQLINELLKSYEGIWKFFDNFICITTNNLLNVYIWRQQQEEGLIKEKGKGMTKDRVVKFVNRYFPVYRLYYDKLATQGLTTIKSKDVESLKIKINLQREIVTVQQSNP